ncbi:DUF397 domain-containing protein [Kitasatospora sp. NPDC101235]|uniref:DUF397 domain-containing protein n=1 Tax=Kitasatospora sp. NPDC101235 TaxID=3364101 RepID=UPI00382C58A3
MARQKREYELRQEGEHTTWPEISARGWYKSSYNERANDCVETGLTVNSGMAVRDSKDTSGPALVVSPDAWTAFVTAIKAGELQRLNTPAREVGPPDFSRSLVRAPLVRRPGAPVSAPDCRPAS